MFGVCANELSADGQVVDAEYGCGAHSDTPAPAGSGSPLYDPFDDGVIEVVEPPAPPADEPPTAPADEPKQPHAPPPTTSRPPPDDEPPAPAAEPSSPRPGDEPPAATNADQDPT